MSKGPIRTLCLTALLFMPIVAQAQDLFTSDGFRAAEYRAPVPETAPGARTVSLTEVQALITQGAILLDVMGLQQYRILPDGSWLVPQPRQTLPNAVWLPVVGWGHLEDWQESYLQDSLSRLTNGDKSRQLVVFCKIDCWLSWNTVKRLDNLGYSNVAWFPGGADAWANAGYPLVPTHPFPAR